MSLPLISPLSKLDHRQLHHYALLMVDLCGTALKMFVWHRSKEMSVESSVACYD